MLKMKNILYSFDYFKKPISLNFNKKEKIPTFIGSILSCIIFVVSITLAVNIGSDIYNKRNPSIGSVTIKQPAAPILQMDNNNLIFVAQYLNRNFEVFRDESVFSLQISLFQNIRYNNGSAFATRTELQQINCSMYFDYFNSLNVSASFDGDGLKTGYCFDNRNISIGGAYVSDYFANIEYSIFKCVNSTNSNITCKSTEEIDRLLYLNYFQIFYLDYFIDSNSYKAPLNYYLNNYFVITDGNIIKSVDHFLKLVTFETDDGLIFESNNTKQVLITDYSRDQANTAVSNQILDVYVNISTNILKMKRTYQKLQNLAATVGGIFNVLTIFGKMIASFFAKHKMYQTLFNSLFIIDENNLVKQVSVDACKAYGKKPIRISRLKTNLEQFKKIKIDNNNKAETVNSQNHFINELRTLSPAKINIFNSNEDNNNNNNRNRNNIFLSKNLVEINDDLNESRKSKKYHLSFFKIIKIKLLYICFSKYIKQKTIFDKTKHKLLEYLDYLEVSKSLYEIKKLKRIIFDESQLKLFDFIEKPKVQEQNERSISSSNNNSKHNNKLESNNEEEFKKCIEFIANKNKRSKMDYRLLHLLDSNVKAKYNID